MRRFVALCSVAIVSVAVFAGCGGGDSDKTTSTVTTPGTNADAGSSDNGSSDNDLSDLIGEASKEKYKITYTNGGSDELTYAQDGKGSSVFGDGDSLTFVNDDATISCEKRADAWECTQSPVSIGAAANPFLGVLTLQKTYFSALGDRFGETTDKTIAGRDAQCVSFSQKDLVGDIGGAIADAAGADLKGSATYCIDKETGTTLEVSGTDDEGKATESLVVTKFETPADSEFTPPATPTQITIPGGGTLPDISLPDITIPGNG